MGPRGSPQVCHSKFILKPWKSEPVWIPGAFAPSEHPAHRGVEFSGEPAGRVGPTLGSRLFGPLFFLEVPWRQGLEPKSNLPALISKTVPGSGGNRQAPTLRNLFLSAHPRTLLLQPATGPALGQLSLSSVPYCPKRLVPGRGRGEQTQALLLDMCGSEERGEQ